MEKIKKLLGKYYDVAAYLFFGGLTTAVDFVVSLLCKYGLHMSGTLSTVIAWAAAVIFAYLTNKPFVFESLDWSMKTVAPEFGKFLGARVGSGVLVTLTMGLTTDILHWNFPLMKILTSIFNIVFNYVASKLLIFRKKES